MDRLFKIRCSEVDGHDEDACSENICAVKLTENGAQSIYCDVCNNIYCIQCMGIQRKCLDFITNFNNIKMVCNKCLKF